MSIRIGIVAGEASGDILGAGVVAELKRRFPDCVIEGVAGPKMQAAGAVSLYEMETLSVMGVWAVLKRLPAILRCRAGLLRHFKQQRPDIFIGIDAPDFNLTLELKLKRLGVKTLHYVSPSVWAWKAWRIHKIKRATDQVLCILPFEVDFYRQHQHPATFIGHPLANQIEMDVDVVAARTTLNLPQKIPMLAVLPGSRSNEIQLLMPVFVEVIRRCHQVLPSCQFVIPLASKRCQMHLAPYKAQLASLPVHWVDGQSQAAMAAADTVLLASGTAALEAMLLKKPMVMAYKLGPLSFWLAKRLVKIQLFSLPNLLANKALIPEYIQDEASAETLTEAVLQRLQHPEQFANVVAEFKQWHQTLRQEADQKVVNAIEALLEKT